MDSIRKILVAVDFHAPSMHALEYAARLARDIGAQVTLFHACDLGAASGGEWPPEVAATRDRADAERVLSALAHVIRADGIAAAVRVVDGSPATEILEAARTSEADLLVLGSHGRHGASRALVGSVAESVTRRAALPVTILHEWRFANRADAASRLATRLQVYKGEIDVTIAIAWSGVPMAIDIARALTTRLDTYLVEPAFGDEGVAIGAVGENGEVLLVDSSVVSSVRGMRETVNAAIDASRARVTRHARALSADPLGNLTRCSVVLVADAIVTPTLAQIAARAVRDACATHVTFAVPMCSASISAALAADVDRTICMDVTHLAPANARVYRDDEALADAEAAQMLTEAGARRMRAASKTA